MKKAHTTIQRSTFISYFAFLTAIIILTASFGSFAADRFWVGGSGNWTDNTNHWRTASGGTTVAAVPTTTDNVYFDANSFTASGQTVTINAAANCLDMNWTGAIYTPTMAGTSTLNIAGSLTFISAMNLTYTGTLTFTATTTGKTITTNGITFKARVNFGNANGGGWTLQDNLASNARIDHNGGTLNTNDKNITCTQFGENAANTRILNLGSSVITLSNSGLAFFTNYAGLTINPGTSTIKFTASDSARIQISSSINSAVQLNNVEWSGTACLGTIDNQSSYALIVNNVSWSGNGRITGTNTFNGSMSMAAGKTYTFTIGKTQTFGTSGNIVSGGSCGNLVTITPSGAGAVTFSKSTAMTVGYVNLNAGSGSIVASGGIPFIANNSTKSGTVTNWTVNAPTSGTVDLYWVNGSGNWNDAAHWSTTSGIRTNPCNFIPGTGNNVYFDAGSFSGSGQTVTVNVAAVCNDMNWTGAANSPTLAGAAALNIAGSLTLNTAMSLTYSGAITFSATSSGKTISSAGNIYNGSLTLGTSAGGEWTLLDNLNCNGQLNHAYGTLNVNDKNISCAAFNENYTNSRVLNLGTALITVTGSGATAFNINNSGFTLNAGTSTISFSNAGSSSLSFTSATTFNNVSWPNSTSTGTLNNSSTSAQGTFNNITFAGSGNIYGNNTFNGSLILTAGKTYAFQSSKTQTFSGNLNATGQNGSQITIKPISGTTAYIFNKTSGCVNLDYIIMSYCTASGGAGFYGGPNPNSTYTSCSGWNESYPAGASPPVGIIITVSETDTLCSNTPVTFVAIPANAGNNPVYQWKRNGITEGTNSATFLFSGPWTDGDTVNCLITADNPCATLQAVSNAIKLHVAPSVAMNATVTASENVVCPGALITFTASVTNSGSAPVYRWKLNGSNVGTGATTFSYSGPWVTGDSVNCEVTSMLGSCLVTNPLVSNDIIINAPATLPVSIGITSNPGTNIAAGTPVIFTATPVNGGTAPTYTWKINGAIQGNNSPTFRWIYFMDGDKVTCDVVSNVGSCAAYNSGTFSVSNVIEMHVTGDYSFYWIGGGGNWSSPNHWALESGGAAYILVPSALNSVYFDANSGFTSGSKTVTVDLANANCKNMEWSGALNTPIFTSSSSSNNLNIHGSLRLIQNMTWNFNGPANFKATTTGNTITAAGKTFNNNIYFDGVSGEWALSDSLQAPSCIIYLSNGSLKTNNNNLICTGFSSNAVSARGLYLGSSLVKCSLYFVLCPTNLTLDAGTSTIRIINGGIGYLDCYNGGTANVDFYNLEFTGTGQPQSIRHTNFPGRFSFNNVSFTSNGEIQGNNKFNSLTLAAGKTYSFQNGKTDSISGNLNASGACGNNIIIQSLTQGSTFTFYRSGGTVNLNYVTLKDCRATGGATFNAFLSDTVSNVSGWNITPFNGSNTNYYWIGGSGNWSQQSHWSLSSGGTAASCIPGATDNVFFDANSGFTSGSKTVTVDLAKANCKSMDWSGVLNTPVFSATSSSNNLNLYGSLTLIQNMTWNFNGPVNFNATTTGNTITSAGKNFNNSVYFDGVSGEWTLIDSLQAVSCIIYLSNGSLKTNNNNLICTGFSSNAVSDRGLYLGASLVKCSLYFVLCPTNLTLDAGTSTIRIINGGIGYLDCYNGGTANVDFYNLEFTGTGQPQSIRHTNFPGRFSFNNVSFTSNGEIQGNNKFNSLTLAAGKTYSFQYGKTDTIIGNLTASGACGNYTIIQSLAPGGTFTFYKSADTVNLNYVTLKDCHATGGATFNALLSDTVSNVSGWNITAFNGSNTSYYWIGGSGSWSQQSHWSLSSGGTAASCIPGSTDNVFFDANSGFTSGSRTVTVDLTGANCKSMDWTGAMNTPTFTSSTSTNLNVFGSITLIQNMTWNYSGAVFFKSTTTGNTITSAGRNFYNNIYFDGVSGEWSLSDSLQAVPGIIYLSNGTLKTNNNNLNCTGFSSMAASDRGLYLGSSLVKCSLYFVVCPANLTFDAGHSTIRINNGGIGYLDCYNGGMANIDFYNLEFTGTGQPQSIRHTNFPGRLAFNNVSFTANGEIRGYNKFNTLTFADDHTYTFEGGKTDTILADWFLPGKSGQPIILQTTGAPVTIYKPDRCVVGDWLQISNINTAGGASFYAGPTAHSTMSNSSGWMLATINSLWLGHTNVWEDPANWDLNGAVPNLATKVRITSCSRYQPTITAVGAVCDSVLIDSLATLVMLGNSVLDVYGNWGNYGTFLSGEGTVNFKGNTLLYGKIPTQFHNAVIGNGDTLGLLGSNSALFGGDLINNGVFNAAQGKLTFNGSAPQSINMGGAPVYTIEFDNTNPGSDDITLLDTMTVQHQAVFSQGVINYSGAGRFIFEDNATSNDGTISSYINGAAIKQGDDAFIFPIGDSTVWAPLGIDPPSAYSEISAKYTCAPPSNRDSVCSGIDSLSKAEYWEITSSNAHPQVTLFWKEKSRIGVEDIEKILLAHWENCGTSDKWVSRTDSREGNADNGWVKSAGLTSYSPLTLGYKTSDPLPVTLHSFEANCTNGMVWLKWSTATETNSDHYIVERSADMRQWNAIANITAAGNSNELKTYEYTDDEPLEGISYYQLRQFDRDGAATLYGPVSTRCSSEGTLVNVYPNPFSGIITIEYVSDVSDEFIVQLLDITGREVYKTEVISGTKQNSTIDLISLAPGIYYLGLKTKSENRYFKIVKE